MKASETSTGSILQQHDTAAAATRTADLAPPTDPTLEGDAAGALPTAVRMLLSQDLFAGSREVCIAHRGALYRLRITMQNRLILQK
ncbi:MAG: hemin uptake protein HemP [Planctomycetales bacterium]|nr:hemin uptake protein HemP [Planctomycetales bacterium]MBN8627617.1 hemin uptake protein HemP [Planctomycetota bacterium]